MSREAEESEEAGEAEEILIRKLEFDNKIMSFLWSTSLFRAIRNSSVQVQAYMLLPQILCQKSQFQLKYIPKYLS